MNLRNYFLLFVLLFTYLTLSLSFPSTTLAVNTEELRIGINKDTYAESAYPEVSPWNNRNFYIGYDTIYNKKRTRAYLHYDIGSLINKKIDSEKVISAELNLYQYYTENKSDYEISIRTINNEWNQAKLNWNNQPNTRYEKSEIVSKSIGWKRFDITQLVKEQLDNPSLHNGIAIFAKNESLHGGIFWSNACSSAPTPPTCNIGEEPYLNIVYSTNEKPEPAKLISPPNETLTKEFETKFVWTESTDPNNDKVNYRLQISTEPDFSTTYFESDWIETTDLKYEIPEDGEYFWKILTKDEFMKPEEAINSEVRKLEIDRTSPPPPVVEVEPPFTYGSQNALRWSFDTAAEKHSVRFNIEVNCPECINTLENFSTNKLGYSWENLFETKYFYKVQAIDSLGNVSAWSNETSTTIDYSVPRINNLKSSEMYISPKSTPGIKDFTTINFGIDDISLKRWRLFFENEKRKIVEVREGINAIHSFNWQPDLPDGFYFAYIEAEDEVGLIERSNIIGIKIDNSPPSEPKILYPKQNSLLNCKEQPFKTVTDPNIVNRLYVNSIEKNHWHGSSYEKIIKSLREGKNRIKIKSEDLAGNIAEKTITLTIDSTPPSPPQVKLIPNLDEQSVYMQILDKGYKKMYIYTPAGLIKTHKYTRKPIKVIDRWSGNTTYKFHVRIEDKAKNLSSRSEEISYKTPSKKEVKSNRDWPDINKIPSESSCEFYANIDTRNVKELSCKISKPELLKLSHESPDKQSYYLTIDGAANPYLNYKVNYYKCKKIKWYDPRTWFKCVDQYYGSKSFRTKLYPDYAFYADKDRLKTYHFIDYQKNDQPAGIRAHLLARKDYSNRRLKAEMFITKNLIITEKNDLKYRIKKSTPSSNSLTIPAYKHTPIKKKNNKPFRFPFSKVIGVTQWYGKTAYNANHSGVDFGAYKEKIYAMADGKVHYAGWNGKKKSCKNGGRILILVHDNGMYTTYAHLSNFNKSNGKALKKGDRIKKGDLIGVTGNSGKYNCKPLGYHLHLETRKGSKWNTHTNPVPYIDIDWNKIKTLNYKRYPGRLSGENPHPKF